MKQIESSGEKKTATKKRGREEEESKIYLLAVESDTNEKMPAVCVYQLYQVSTALPKGFDYIYIIQYEVATAIPSGYGYTKWLQQYQMATAIPSGYSNTKWQCYGYGYMSAPVETPK